MIIDTHHHFWNYNPVDFGWINDEMALIRKNFQPLDLQKELKKNGVGGVISVQSRQNVEETDTLLNYAREYDFIKGVVGWLPLVNDNLRDLLEKYSPDENLKGLRHVVQGEPDPEFLLGKLFSRGISMLKDFNLVYDILIYEHQLPNTIRFVDHHPDQKFVLDHIAKPKIKINEIESWKKNITELAKRENIACKISGMVTEADYQLWTSEQLQPYFDVVFEAFGTNRILFGSDWPVCLVASSYSDWIRTVKQQLSSFTGQEQEQILYKNAINFYNILR